MKTAIWMFCVVLLTTVACAQKNADSKTPEAVRTAFAKLNPNTTKVKWEKEEANYEANFKIGEAEQSMVFAADGTLLESETAIDINELPLKVQEYLAQNFKGSKVKEAAKLTDANGKVSFEAEIKGKDLFFDENGNLNQ
jgi:hypothetical protein